MIRLTKEIAHHYLTDRKTIEKLRPTKLADFEIISIESVKARPGIRQHQVVVIQYVGDSGTLTNRYIHITEDIFMPWYRGYQLNQLELN